MKQVLLSLKTGKTEVVEVPSIQTQAGHLLTATSVSLISAGTERMLVDFGRAGLIEKARREPDKVTMAINKIKTDGLVPTLETIRAKLDLPVALGYNNVGRVIEIGKGLKGFSMGDRIVSNGPHAEIACVSKNLCAKVPEDVSSHEAAFTVLGAVGLQGIRIANPTLGETFVVSGLGLIGLMVVQMLRANSCNVIGIDLDSSRVQLASRFGAVTVDLKKGGDPIEAAMALTGGRGVDGVIVTAATKSSEPIHQAAQMCRKKGRIVLVGVTGMHLKRNDFYEKELSFHVSCSYGPGRYDIQYEEKGQDYPYGIVRWTEQRNFEAVLGLMAAGKLDVKPLISHRFQFEGAEKAYELISDNKEPYLGIILEYETADECRLTRSITLDKRENSVYLRSAAYSEVVVGLIGAGNFTGQVLLPAFKKSGVRLKMIASSGGISGTHLGRKFGFEESCTDLERIFAHSEINTVFITTRHNTHARFVLQALQAGKHVFVEKPLCISENQLEEIIESYNELRITNNSLLMVGFNRRFAPCVAKVKELLEVVREPKSFIMTVNAGMIPPDHWTQDPDVGGGRIIGEACHFVDLLMFLAGSKITSIEIVRLKNGVEDTVSIQISFLDGSIGTIHYFANGNKSFPKERLEVFSGQKILQLDNFKVLRGYGWKHFKKMNLWRQDKGHGAEIKAFVEAVRNGGPCPIPFEEIVEVMRTTIRLSERTGV